MQPISMVNCVASMKRDYLVSLGIAKVVVVKRDREGDGGRSGESLTFCNGN